MVAVMMSKICSLERVRCKGSPCIGDKTNWSSITFPSRIGQESIRLVQNAALTMLSAIKVIKVAYGMHWGKR
jgi:hypothetical protein